MGRSRIKLFQLSRGIGVSNESIVEILVSAGFAFGRNNANLALSSKHLDVIARVYVNSIKQYHKRASLDYKTLTPKKRKDLKSFLSLFILNSEELSIEEILNSKLDNELIFDFFNSRIYRSSVSSRKSEIDYILRKIKLIFCRCTSEGIIISTPRRISNSNHIYPDEEEDHIRKGKQNLCFSNVIGKPREALLNFEIYNKLLDEKYKLFNWTNRTVQFAGSR